jgi:hypothetical protein
MAKRASLELNSNEFGKLVKSFRLQRGWSQGELANKWGHSREYISLHLTDEEKARIQLNEEYVASQWIDPVSVIENADHFHPCLVQIARDLVR